MAAAGARAQKPVGSAAWISTEKENVTQLVDQEMEEVEYPVRHEMDWLNEHMSEIFSNNQFNFTEAFKTPGKLRGKTPRTARKRDANEPRLPLSEVFSSSHKRVENKFNASPAAHRSPTKAIPPPTLAPSPTKNKNTAESARPEYPDLSKNLNSFPKYNTDSGYHGMQLDEEADDNDDGDDDMILTQVQPESQASTQPFEKDPAQTDAQEQRSSPARRTTGGSFHSAQENVRQRGETVEPVQPAPSPKKRIDEPSLESPPKTQEAEPTEISSPVHHKTPQAPQAPQTIKKPEPEPAPQPSPEPEIAAEEEPKKVDEEQHGDELELVQEQEPVQDPEPAQEPETKHEDQAAQTAKSSPVKAPIDAPVEAPVKASVEPPSEPQPEQREDNQNNEDDGDEQDEMALDDNLDDIGSPSDGSTPERPPIRKSSLSFASLPAREPLMKKSLGGTRLSRTSHIDTSKLSGFGGSNYLGRQTGGHRMTQTAADDNASLNDKMDVDEDREIVRDDEQDADTRASKLHTKSSTQRLHEKISMLGKLQPSRPTKSIPSAPSLAPTQVSYPELPPAKPETRPEGSSRRSHEETPAPEPTAVDDDWIKPFSSPYKTSLPKTQARDLGDKKPSPAAELERSSKKDSDSVPRIDPTNNEEKSRTSAKETSEEAREKSSTPVYASPHRSFHKRNGSFSYNDSFRSTTPVGSPSRHLDGPISASKSRLQSIVRSAKGLFSNAGGVSAAAKLEASSPSESPSAAPHPRERANTVAASEKQQRPVQPSSPRPEGRRTRSSTEQKRKQKELEDRRREEEEEEERAEKARQEKQEKQRAAQLKAAQEKAAQEKAAQEKAAAEKAAAEEEARAAQNSRSITAPTAQRIPQMQRQTSREPENTSQASKQGRPVKPNRDTLQKPKPQPVSIRVGSALSRQIPMASSVTESNLPAPAPASTTKQPGLKKKASNTSLHTASSNSSFKSTASTQSQRKAQLASERKREQEEREARRKEEQRREVERRRAAQQQEEARRQEMRSRAENERRERLASEDPKKAAQMQAIEKRRLENARRLERQGSQQPNDTAPSTAPQSAQPPRPASRLGSIQPFGRSINPPQPNPAKPPKRGLDEEASHRPAATKTSTIQPSGETKRRRTEDEHNPAMRPTMAPPIRQSNIRKESNIRKDPTKPSIFSHGKPSMSQQGGSSIFKTAQPQRPAHPMDMAKYTTGKIPFAEPSNAQPAQPHKTPGASSSQKAPAKPSPKYPSGENIHLPEIATDSEDEDSEAEMLPVPKWAQPKELESLLRQQEGMEVDSIFGPIAPFSLEDTFKADKKIKKFRERTSSANWAGTDALTQEEIRRDLAERQRLRLNGGWTFGN